MKWYNPGAKIFFPVLILTTTICVIGALFAVGTVIYQIIQESGILGITVITLFGILIFSAICSFIKDRTEVHT